MNRKKTNIKMFLLIMFMIVIIPTAPGRVKISVYLKGSVQRKLRWVSNIANRWILAAESSENLSGSETSPTDGYWPQSPAKT
jgi:hypothetical protein